MRSIGFIALLCGWAGCQGASGDPGTRALLRVANAQFVPGRTPAGESGPAVLNVILNSYLLKPGLENKSLQGSVAGNASAVALALDGDAGYWIIGSGTPDPLVTGVLAFKARLSFSPELRAGSYQLLVRAVDERGEFGPVERRSLMTSDAPVDGKLVVALSWSNDADLDLHVVDPSGAEIWARNPIAAGAYLDVDSNANCLIDGRRLENVIWKSAPPSGHYLVRVDAASLCGQPESYWQMEVRLDGAVLGASHGTALPSDADLPHDRGAGLLVLGFNLP